MLDTEVYLEKLDLFGRILRDEGMEVSPKENADALAILLDLGFEDKQTVKTALRSVYAKSRDEQLRFDRIFDAFFLPEDAIRAIDKKHTEEELKKRQQFEQAQKELENQKGSFSDTQIEAYSNLSDEEKEHLKELQERFKGTDRSEELYASFIHSVFAKYILEEQMRMEDAAIGAGPTDPELGLIFRDISDFKDNEIPKAVSYIQGIASRINGELSKKRKNNSNSGALDFRRTIRKGLETGGSFNKLAFKKKRKRRKQLVLLCDVSASMIRFSEFALRFIKELGEASDNSRIILFSEGYAEADPFHLQNMDLFREYVKNSGLYGKGTDMGTALKKLNDERPSALSMSTVLIILSDAKTVNPELCAAELTRARSRAGKVICLNPIPEHKWKYSGSITTAAKYCTMIPCSTLSELGSACRKLFAE